MSELGNESLTVKIGVYGGLLGAFCSSFMAWPFNFFVSIFLYKAVLVHISTYLTT